MTIPVSAYVLLPAFIILAVIFRRDLFALAIASSIFEAASILSLGSGGSGFGLPIWIPMLGLSCLMDLKASLFLKGKNVEGTRLKLDKRALLSMTVFFVYSLLSAFLMPFIFQGLHIAAGLSSRHAGESTLRFGTTNLTQSAYLILCAIIFYRCVFMSSPRVQQRIADFYVNACVVSAFIGLYQVIAITRGWYFPKEVIYSNEAYAQLYGVQTAGLFRLTATFSESSLAALFFAGSFGLVLTRCTRPNASMWDVLKCLLFALVLVLTFSTTAYIILPIGLIYFFAKTAMNSVHSRRAVSIGLLAVAMVAAVGIYAMNSSITPLVNKIENKVVSQKANSKSYRERTAANAESMALFRGTLFLGAGLGSYRASSALLQLLGCVGLVGTCALFYSILRMYFRRKTKIRLSAYRESALVGLALMFGAQLVAIPDLDTPFVWALLGALVQIGSINPMRATIANRGIRGTAHQYAYSGAPGIGR